MEEIVPYRRRQRIELNFSLASVNIVFLLLLFFLVAGALVQPNEAEVRAPETRTLPPDRLPRPLLVIDAAGELSLDGGPIAREALLKRVAGSEDNPAFTILNIMPDRNLNAGLVLGLIEEIRANGDTFVRVVTVKD